MKWKSHKLLTGSIVFSFSGDIALTVAAVVGSVLPDALEKIPYYFGYTRKNHRQLSHWFIPYFIAFLGLYHGAVFLGMDRMNRDWLAVILYQNLLSQAWEAVMSYIAAGIFLGACFHVLQDALCGTVPFLTPKQRIGKLFFNVGSAKEYMIVIVCSTLLLYLTQR